MLIRGLILLLIVSVALLIAVRTVLKTGHSPTPCDTASQTCVGTARPGPGG